MQQEDGMIKDQKIGGKTGDGVNQVLHVATR